MVRQPVYYFSESSWGPQLHYTYVRTPEKQSQHEPNKRSKTEEHVTHPTSKAPAPASQTEHAARKNESDAQPTHTAKQPEPQSRAAITWEPLVDVYSTDNSVDVLAYLPGVEKSSLALQYDSATNTLVLSGERTRSKSSQSDEPKPLYTESVKGPFRRIVNLSQIVEDGVRFDADKVTANFETGVLKVTVPHQAQEPTTRRIDIS